MSNRTKTLLKIILPILIIAFGVIVAKQLVQMRRAPHKAEKPKLGTLVRVMEVKKTDVPVIISATGTVQSRRRVDITPQVSGKVIWIDPDFMAGGFFREGDRLFSLEKDDYELDLEKAGAELAQAELDLTKVNSQADIARREWNTLHPDTPPSPLVVFEPQVKSAQARVTSAKATIRRGQLDLKRTTLFAPFNCRIRSENIDIGQYVRSGSSVAQIAGTSVAEAIIHLSPDELQWLTFPKTSTSSEGSKASITFSGTGKEKTWEGHVVRSLGEIDTKSRMVGIVVAVEDPYNLLKHDPFNLPLAEGLFISVNIKGKPLRDTVEIPRSAFRDDSCVWIAAPDNTLLIRQVTASRKSRDAVLISTGLDNGERVITSGVNGAANGMKLRILSGEKAQ
jgi:RND family efflux transporter MFP subunit